MMTPSDLAKSLKDFAESAHYATIQDTINQLVMAAIKQMGEANTPDAVQFQKGKACGLMMFNDLFMGMKNITREQIESLLNDEAEDAKKAPAGRGGNN